MTFKGTKQTIKEITEKVHVRYVLEGSVRKSENNLRIVAQLIDAESDAHIWAEKYNGTLDNVFDIQEKVSKSIAEALKITLNPVEQKRISEVTIEDVQAYERYLQARQEIYRFTENGLERGIHLINNGLEIIGENEILYAAMGTAYFFYIDAGIKPGTDYLQKIEECTQRIFNLNPESSHGYFLSGAVHFLKRNLQQAVRDLKKSLERNPNNPDCLNQLVRIYSSCGKNEAARKLLDKTLEIDPFNAIAFSLPGYLQLLKGDFDRAKESYYKMYRMDPESPIFGSFYTWALFIAGRNDEAIEVIDGLEKAASNSIYTHFGLLIKFAVLGQKERALEVITPEMESVAKVVEYQSRAMTQAYALLGEKEKALNWLENTIECGFINYPFLSDIDPFLENIRGEERFKKLMERVKHEWENFEV
jgi:tetratricopeptide (TPR) repeat protein